MKRQANVYLFTQECKSLFLKENKHKLCIYRRVERKLTQIHHKVIRDNLPATIHSNLIYKQISIYINDIKSEIKKYESIIGSNEKVKAILKELKGGHYPFVKLNRLTNALNEALILTDKLVILLITALKNNLFEDNGTFISIKSKVRKKLFYLIGKINRISIRKFDDITVQKYLISPDKYQNLDLDKIKNILSIGFVPKYVGVDI